MKVGYFKNISGFTLPELIITITIITILSTIGFVSIQNFYGSTRDSVRITDIKSLLKGLTIFQLKAGTYPLPENPIEITVGVTLLSYQGYVWDDISRVIKTNKTPLDPKDATRYIYTTDKAQKKAQLMGYLESGDTLRITWYRNVLHDIIDQSYAANVIPTCILQITSIIGE